MKAISLLQPWATLVAVGAKRLETRSWSTPYRGRIAIHASKGFGPVYRFLAGEEPFRSALAAGGYQSPGELPRGAVVALATLVDCIPVTTTCGGFARFARRGNFDDIPASELPFGDFGPGRWAWVLEDVVRLEEPYPARGSLGVWTWIVPPHLGDDGRMREDPAGCGPTMEADARRDLMDGVRMNFR